MEGQEAMRRHPRLSVGPEYQVRLAFGGRELEGAELQNLSACGCGVKVPRSECAGLENGVTLDWVYMLHPGLPCVPFQATVVRLLGKTGGTGLGYVLLGLDFVYVTPTVSRLIDHHVTLQLGA